MSMHLVPPYLNNTGSSRAAKPARSKQQVAAELAHEKFLRSRGLHPDQLAARQRPRTKLRSEPVRSNVAHIPSESVFEGATGSVPTARPAQVYTGERKLLGIATMHKSNMVPVFADCAKDAVDIARMRR